MPYSSFRAACLLLVAAPASGFAGEVSIHRTGVLTQDTVDVGAIAVADFDADGRDEIAVLTGLPLLLQVVGLQSDGRFAVEHVRALEPHGEAPDLALVPGLRPGLLVAGPVLQTQFAGWPPRAVRRTPLAEGGGRVAVADIDADGDLDRVAAFSGGLVATELAGGGTPRTYSVEWAEGMALAQLDADAALEIVFGTTPGVVIDGATFTPQFTWPDGFGRMIAPARLPSGPGFIVADHAYVFGGTPLAMRWSPDSTYQGAVGAVDFDGDRVDEVVIHHDFNVARVFDAGTRAMRMDITSPTNRPSEIVAADMDGDGREEAVLVSGDSGFSGPTLVHVAGQAGFPAGAALKRLPRSTHAALARGDVDGDGDAELAIASHGNRPLVRLIDPATQAVEWEMPPPGFNDQYFKLQLLQLDDDVALEIVLSGGGFGGLLRAIDGAGKATQFSRAANNDFLTGNTVHAALVADVDADGVRDLLVATEPRSNLGSVRVAVLDPLTGATRWESAALGNAADKPLALSALPLDGDAALEIVLATTDGWRALDGASHALEWQFDRELKAATVAPGADGPELVGAEAGRLVHRSIVSRDVLRDYAAPEVSRCLAPLAGHDGLLIATADVFAIVYDGRRGVELARTERLGGPLDAHCGLPSDGEGLQRRAWLGSNVGWFELSLQHIHRLFGGGFED